MPKLKKLLLGMMMGVLITPAIAQDDTDAIDADAMNDLENMGTYLRTLKAFRVIVTAENEVVLDDGQKLQYQNKIDMLARAPDGLRAHDVSDSHERMYFYDGEAFTLWAKRANYYATVDAPSTIAGLVDQLQDRYGMPVPLSDLFLWGTDESNIAAITSAMDAGPAGINGITCEQYAFRQADFDWQLWIQKGDYPLPCKLVITSKTDEARPQYSAVYDWNLAPSYNDSAFIFDAPDDAQRVVLENLNAETDSDEAEE